MGFVMLFYFNLVIAMCFIILTLSGFLVSHVIVLWGERRSHEVNLWICFSSSVHHLQQTRLCCIFVFRKGGGGGGDGGDHQLYQEGGREEQFFGLSSGHGQDLVATDMT